jgi:hypothetical protein
LIKMASWGPSGDWCEPVSTNGTVTAVRGGAAPVKAATGGRRGRRGRKESRRRTGYGAPWRVYKQSAEEHRRKQAGQEGCGRRKVLKVQVGGARPTMGVELEAWEKPMQSVGALRCGLKEREHDGSAAPGSKKHRRRYAIAASKAGRTRRPSLRSTRCQALCSTRWSASGRTREHMIHSPGGAVAARNQR